jgi:hypothetical protein
VEDATFKRPLETAVTHLPRHRISDVGTMDSAMNQEQLDEMTKILIGTLGDLNRLVFAAQNAQKNVQEIMSNIHKHQVSNYTPEQRAMYDMLLERNKK